MSGSASFHRVSEVVVRRHPEVLESSVSDYLFFLRGRPPFRPLSLAALALAADRARPPFVPPVLPQFLNISITALGRSARRVLLRRLAIQSGF
jgi:hypothetical protein